MHAGIELWIPVLAGRGTLVALAFSTLVLAGILAAGLGGLSRLVRV